MKLYVFSFFMLIIFTSIRINAQNYLWPVENKKTGEGIIYQPQSYIGQEQNDTKLIISSTLNTNILSPVDGTVVLFKYVTRSSLNHITMYGKMPTDFAQDSLYFAETGMYDLQFLNLAIGIETSDRTKVYIEGLRPSRVFKTGQKVQRGEVIGTTGYYYKGIDDPCICVSITKNDNAADPMTPFGLNTTFQNQSEKRKNSFTKQEAIEDYSILVDALKEGFPGLYDYVSETEFHHYTTSEREMFGEMVSTSELEKSICATLGLIRDSHTRLMNPSNDNPRYSSIDFGIQGDSMVITRTNLADSKYLGKQVLSIDGIPADSMKSIIAPYISQADGFVNSYINFELLCQLDLRYCRFIQTKTSNYDLLVEFANGETKLFKGGIYDNNNKCFPRTPSWKNWYLTNQLESVNFRMISDTTAYLGIRDFDLNQLEMEQIRERIAQTANDGITSLIIDLRNNYGGNEEAASKIYSYIAQEPFRQEIFRKVNKRGNFDFFRYSTNHGAKYCQRCATDEHCEGEILFPDYEPTSNDDDFILDLSNKWNYPDSLVNYKNKVYLLVNERSFSAASVFAGWVKKQERGVIVGRETGSSYHQMKAIKFENLLLPNSKYIVHFPLVKIVMDTIVNECFPYGRGVLPDYEVKLSLDELSNPNDTILGHVTALIKEGRYFPKGRISCENDFASDFDNVHLPKSNKSIPFPFIVCLAFALVLSISVVIIKKRHHAN